MNIDLDINTLRVMATVACFVVFIAILAWTFSRRNRSAFDSAAQIPLNDE